jgi:ATP-binding cassette subfamily C protein CydCD
MAIVLRAALEQTRTMIAHRTAARVQETLRARLFDKILALGPAWFRRQPHRGRDALGSRRRRAAADFLRAIPAAAHHIGGCARRHFLVHSLVGPAGGHGHARRALFALVLPGLAHRSNRAASVARQKAFKSFGEEFLDAIQGLPTLKAFGQGRAYGRRLAEKARTLSSETMWVLGASVMTRGITDIGIAAGAAGALALGAWRVSHGQMSLEALLIVLMAGTEIFRPLRDLRTVLHQGMNGQSAAAGVQALLAAVNRRRRAARKSPRRRGAGPPSPSRTSVSPIRAYAVPRSRISRSR